MSTVDITQLKADYIAKYGAQTIAALIRLGGDPDKVMRDCVCAAARLPDEFHGMFRRPRDAAFSAYTGIVAEIERRYFETVPREEAAAVLHRISRDDGDAVCICHGEPGLTFSPAAYADAWYHANPDQPPLIPLGAGRD